MDSTFFDSLTYFQDREFVRPEIMNREFLALLDLARHKAGIPFVITSSYRTDSVSHENGFAVDIACASARARFKIVQALVTTGFNRIGVYDKHIHVDIDPSLDRAVIWLGKSRSRADEAHREEVEQWQGEQG